MLHLEQWSISRKNKDLSVLLKSLGAPHGLLMEDLSMKFSVELITHCCRTGCVPNCVFWILTLFLSIFFKQFWFINVYRSHIMLPGFGRKEAGPLGCSFSKLLP